MNSTLAALIMSDFRMSLFGGFLLFAKPDINWPFSHLVTAFWHIARLSKKVCTHKKCESQVQVADQERDKLVFLST